jgi:hypothetical protein
MSIYKKVGFGDNGSSGGSSTPFSFNFSSTEWTIDGSLAYITVAQATHLKGFFPTVEVYEIVSFNLEKINTEVILNASGDVTIQVSFIPDLRFSGKLIIS